LERGNQPEGGIKAAKHECPIADEVSVPSPAKAGEGWRRLVFVLGRFYAAF
jgi:hypothetical protein